MKIIAEPVAAAAMAAAAGGACGWGATAGKLLSKTADK